TAFAEAVVGATATKPAARIAASRSRPKAPGRSPACRGVLRWWVINAVLRRRGREGIWVKRGQSGPSERSGQDRESADGGRCRARDCGASRTALRRRQPAGLVAAAGTAAR